MKIIHIFLFLFAFNIANAQRTLIVFFDGLRPDYITPKAMPNLYAFSQQACYGHQHHSVFPTVTRVNASSYATGSYPATHGILGNTVYFPEVDSIKGLNTGNASDLNRIAAATHGHLLTQPSLGEILAQHGKKMMVFSSGSTGQALLQNHTVSGGAIINPDMILPDSLKPILEKELGPIPPSADPNTARHKWVTDALLKYGFTSDGPLVNAIWFSDPDGAAHKDGIGSPAAMASILEVDAQFGRILDYLKSHDLDKKVNIIVSADHGFVTHKGKHDIKEIVGNDALISDGALYVKDHNPVIIQKLVTNLQAQPWIGAIFTRGARPGDTQGSIPGTLSFGSIHWNHPDRTADILVDYNWDSTSNTASSAKASASIPVYLGSSYSRGVAGHGSFSPFEVHIALLASGPSFKPGRNDYNLPTSNVDILPTILAIYNIPIPPSADGRPLSHLFASDTRLPGAARTEILTTQTPTYTLRLHRTIYGKYVYCDYAEVVHKKSPEHFLQL